MNIISGRACLLVLGICLLSSQAKSTAGYVNISFSTGSNLFGNPLQNSPNNLSTLFGGSTPNGTTLSLWNSAALTYDTVSTYQVGIGWSLDLTLNPGTGALLTSSSAFTNTFVGEPLNHDGTPFTNLPILPPPLYAGPNGLFLLADKAPIGSTGNDIFLNIFGRAPTVGEQVITLTGTSTYLGGGLWDNTPTLSVGEAAFLNIGPVAGAEPTVMGILFLGGIVFSIYRRQRD